MLTEQLKLTLYHVMPNRCIRMLKCRSMHARLLISFVKLVSKTQYVLILNVHYGNHMDLDVPGTRISLLMHVELI